MASLTFYGGVKELGGTKLLLDDNGSRVMIDFGINFDRYAQFYTFPQYPKKFVMLNTLLEFGIYPDVKGLYRWDYTDDRSPPAVDGVLLSHAHIDHADGITYLRPDIPVYSDPSTKRILHAMEHTGNSRSQFLHFTSDAWLEKAREEGVSRKQVKMHRAWKVFHPPEPFKIGNIDIEPFYIDHSLPGACAFIIHTSAGAVVYTGDLRKRGRRPEDTERFIAAAAAAKPKYLLCEGSLIDKPHVGSEDEVADAVYKFSKDKQNMKLVFAVWPPRDIDRLVSFYKAAHMSKRKLVINTKQAYLLDSFAGQPSYNLGYPTSKSEVIRVYMPKKGAGTLDSEFSEDVWVKDYYNWEKPYVKRKNRITLDEIKENPQDYIMFLSGTSPNEFVELNPPEGSGYIRSVPEPYTDEMELGEKRLLHVLNKYKLIRDTDENWLFKKGDSGIPLIHVTGHMSLQETADLVNKIKPDVLIPIHTLYPENFKDFYKGETRIIGKNGDSIEL
jgi:ribonuclease J